jgi:hypothetical protein
MSDETASATQTAALIDESVRTLRDAFPGGVAAPQNAWQILVSLLDVPGRLANTLTELGSYLRNAVDDFATDDDAEPAVRVLDAVEALAAAARALAGAGAPMHRAAEAVSRLRLTPATAWKAEATTVGGSWQVMHGDVLIPVDQAAWLGDSLGILIAAIHHPDTLRTEQPTTDPGEVAVDVLDLLEDRLRDAVETAEAQQQARLRTGELDPEDVPTGCTISRAGEWLRVSPGSELGMLGMSLDIFARAVMVTRRSPAREIPAEDQAVIDEARGAIAYSAAAWVKELQALTP